MALLVRLDSVPIKIHSVLPKYCRKQYVTPFLHTGHTNPFVEAQLPFCHYIAYLNQSINRCVYFQEFLLHCKKFIKFGIGSM